MVNLGNSKLLDLQYYLMWKSISERNSRLYILTQFFQALQFVIPIYIMFQTGFLSTSQIAFLAGWGYFVQLVLELPTGAFADLVGKKASMLWAFLATVIAYFIIPWAYGFWMFLLIETLGGLATALFSGAQEALLYDSLKQDHKENEFSKVLATNGFWYQIGLMVATATGGILYGYGHLFPFILSGITAVIGGIITLLLIEPRIDTDKFSLNNYLNQIKMGVNEINKNTETKLLSSYYILVGSLTWMCQSFFNSYLLIDLGFSDQTRGFIAAGLRLFNIVVLMKLIKNEKIFTHRNTIIFFPTIMIISMIPGIFLHGIWGIPTVAGVMMASTARWILLAKYTNESYDSRYRATAISALSMAIGVVFVFGTTVSGPIMQYFGGARTIFTIFGIISAITIIPLVNKILKLSRYAK